MSPTKAMTSMGHPPPPKNEALPSEKQLPPLPDPLKSEAPFQEMIPRKKNQKVGKLSLSYSRKNRNREGGDTRGVQEN